MAITIARRSISFLTLSFLVFSANLYASTRFDFDGDHRADLAVFRPSNGTWYIIESQTGTMKQAQFGQAGDVPLNADFDGDTRADITIWRPSDGTWWFLRSSNGTSSGAQWGQSGDMPLTGDYDGDGVTDLGVWRPSDGINYIVRSSGGFLGVQWGMDGDVPAHADIDNDGRTDFVVYRPSIGKWYTLRDNTTIAGELEFGAAGDVPVKGDFDGDHKGDFAVYRPSTGTFWWAASSQNNAHRADQWGFSTDTPVPADYDGDGRDDFAVWRPSNGTWYYVNSGSGSSQTVELGVGSDISLPSSPAVPPTAAFTCDFYASPTGTVNATGTSASPWELQTALNKTTLITNGKTLCLKGGTYRGKFTSRLNNATVRSARNEWAVIDGYRTTQLLGTINGTSTTIDVGSTEGIGPGENVAFDDGDVNTVDEVMNVLSVVDGDTISVQRGWNGTTAAGHATAATIMHIGVNLMVDGDNSTYRDLEIWNSYPNRISPAAYTHEQAKRGHAISQFDGTGNNYINLILHDNVDGIFTGSSTSNTMIYGVLTYNNGQTNEHGNGLYLQSVAGYSRVYETIALNNFGSGAQLFGVTGPYVGGDTRGSVFANNGSPNNYPDGRRTRNLLAGTASQRSPTYYLADSHFWHPSNVAGYLASVGYSAGIDRADVLNNYFVGGSVQLDIGSTATGTITGNRFYSNLIPPAYPVIALTAAGRPYTWNNNTYFKIGWGSFNVVGTGLLDFPVWKTTTGFDANSTAPAGALPDTAVVRPNSYQAGRANIIVYVPNGSSSVNVNLSTTGLTNGQSYTIKNAFNYSGPIVTSGTYNSSSPTISLPLDGAARSVATPIGHTFTPATTLSEFGVFIVVPTTP